jgi:hypothetical protein
MDTAKVQVLFGKGLLLAMGLVVAGWFFQQMHKSTRQKQAETMIATQWRSMTGELANRHGAVLDWEARIPDRAGLASYSIDVSRALISSNAQPVLLVMILKDVVEKDGVYNAVFGDYESKHQFSYDLRLQLQCTKEQADKLLRASDLPSREFAVVARISGVARPRFAVRGTHGEEGETGVELIDSSDIFLAKGVCVDLLAKEIVVSSRKLPR